MGRWAIGFSAVAELCNPGKVLYWNSQRPEGTDVCII